MENTLKKPMTGIIPPLVTPLLDNDKLDIDGLERLIERLIKGGVHGLSRNISGKDDLKQTA